VPLQAVYVEANYKETQLTRMYVGQPVSIEVDAFPGAKLRGHVDSLAPASGSEFSLLPAQNATGNFTKIVQRVPVKIVLEADEPLRGRLRPGMSVVATVDTHSSKATQPATALSQR
jgi:membrane fusion protein (multidrug efflux system)